MPFFKPAVSFSLNIASPFSVMIDNSSVVFISVLYKLEKKFSQSANFNNFECSGEIKQIP